MTDWNFQFVIFFETLVLKIPNGYDILKKTKGGICAMGDEKIQKFADLHTHSKNSTDGTMSVDDLVNDARATGVHSVSVTDHNTMNHVIDYMRRKSLDMSQAIQDVDGIDFVPGVEVTCRIEDVTNLKGNTAKIHMLVYAPDLRTQSLFLKLLDIKRENDIAYDFGDMIQISKLHDVDLRESTIRREMEHLQRIKGSTEFSKQDLWKFFNYHYPHAIPSNKRLNRELENVIKVERMNMSALDVIKLAHSVGALCIMAHPEKNLNRVKNKKNAIATLVDYDIDGFELISGGMTRDTSELIRYICKDKSPKNEMLFTGGSDFHGTHHGKLGHSMGKPIDEESQAVVIKNLRLINKARAQGDLTHRVYKSVPQFELQDIVNKYQKFANENKIMEGRLPIFMDIDKEK